MSCNWYWLIIVYIYFWASSDSFAHGKFRCSRCLKWINLHILLCLLVYVPKTSSVWQPDMICEVASALSLHILHELPVVGLIMFIVALVHNSLSCAVSISRSLPYLRESISDPLNRFFIVNNFFTQLLNETCPFIISSNLFKSFVNSSHIWISWCFGDFGSLIFFVLWLVS